MVEGESEKQALDLQFLQNSGAVPKQNQSGIQVSKTTFVVIFNSPKWYHYACWNETEVQFITNID